MLGARNGWVDCSTHLLLAASGRGLSGQPRGGVCLCKLPYHATTCMCKPREKRNSPERGLKAMFAVGRRRGRWWPWNSDELLGHEGSSGKVAEGWGTLMGDQSRLWKLRILQQMGVVVWERMGSEVFCWVGLQQNGRLWQSSAGLGRACREWGGHKGCQASKCGIKKVEQKSWCGRAQAAMVVSGRES